MELTAPSTSRFQAILAAQPEWKSIDDIVAACDKERFFDGQFRHAAENRAKKAPIRHLIHSLKDNEGYPLYASITVLDDNGKPKRVYKQEMLFNPEDYRKIVKYHEGLSEHHKKRAAGYVIRCELKHGTQLWFSDMGPRKDAPTELDEEWRSEDKPKQPR